MAVKTLNDIYTESVPKEYTESAPEQMTLPGIDDPINNPQHYCKSSIQPLDVFKDWAKDEDPLLFYFKTQIIKYLKRERDKGKLQDLKKAQFFVNELVKQGEIYYGN